MSVMSKIIDKLRQTVDENEERAYKILGAKPGPGLDLEIVPVEPLCGKWFVTGITDAGRNFVERFWFEQPLQNNHKLSQLKKEAIDWGLKFHIVLTPVSLTAEKPKVDR
jgi:hypothetical protein